LGGIFYDPVRSKRDKAVTPVLAVVTNVCILSVQESSSGDATLSKRASVEWRVSCIPYIDTSFPSPYHSPCPPPLYSGPLDRVVILLHPIPLLYIHLYYTYNSGVYPQEPSQTQSERICTPALPFFKHSESRPRWYVHVHPT